MLQRTAETNVFGPGMKGQASVKSIQYLRDNVYLSGNMTAQQANLAMMIQGTNTPSQGVPMTNSGPDLHHMETTHIAHRSDFSQLGPGAGASTKEGNFIAGTTPGAETI